ncbi:MAG: hypothetical protein ACYC69_00965 [Thermodesulfovibrionales bacterium]
MLSRELWVFLFMIGFLVFNWPFLEIFSDALPYYLFGAWGAYILVVKVLTTIMQRRGE